MSRIHVVVEGQTEEGFVRDVLIPYLTEKQCYVTYSIVHTKILKDGPNMVGGTSTYGKLKYDVMRVLRNPVFNHVTTLLDYYALPHDFPGRATVPQSSPENKVKHVERAIDRDINNEKFASYLSLHEFEAFLFADPEVVQETFPETTCQSKLEAIRNQFASPEDINDSPHTAPSKRLELIFGGEYQKAVHGPLIAQAIGLDRLRVECPHFDEWVCRLESF